MTTIPDEDTQVDTQVTVAASAVLNVLPADTVTVLQKYSVPDQTKIAVRFKAVGQAPILKQQVYQISAGQRFEVVSNSLRRKLRLDASDSMFLYINSTFAPAMDDLVGNLYNCFKIDNQLIVNYCTTPAFG